MFSFSCPACGALLSADSARIGTPVACGKCKAPIRIPAPPLAKAALPDVPTSKAALPDQLSHLPAVGLLDDSSGARLRPSGSIIARLVWTFAVIIIGINFLRFWASSLVAPGHFEGVSWIGRTFSLEGAETELGAVGTSIIVYLLARSYTGFEETFVARKIK